MKIDTNKVYNVEGQDYVALYASDGLYIISPLNANVGTIPYYDVLLDCRITIGGSGNFDVAIGYDEDMEENIFLFDSVLERECLNNGCSFAKIIKFLQERFGLTEDDVRKSFGTIGENDPYVMLRSDDVIKELCERLIKRYGEESKRIYKAVCKAIILENKEK